MLRIFHTDAGSFAFDNASLALYEVTRELAIEIEMQCVGTYEDNSYVAPEEDIADGRITRLVLLVTRDCNLACTYCFADYVRERTNKKNMSLEVGRAAIEKTLTAFGPIGRIQFFGGEPLLVLPMILQLVEHCNWTTKELSIPKPAYSITTNGTRVTDEVITFLLENDVQVTVSLDGSRDANDKHRLTKQGGGTYDTIRAGIDRLRAAGITVRVEAVFTSDHLQLGESVLSTYSHLTDIGARSIHLTPAVGKTELDGEKALASEFKLATEAVMDTFLTNTPICMPYVFFVLESLASGKAKSYFCDAGMKGITVDTNGDVYPCYTLLSPTLKMGNVLDSNYPGAEFQTIQKSMQSSHKGTFTKCMSCWARPLCSACYADSFGLNGQLEPPQEAMCEMIRATTEAIITKVAVFRNDPTKWKVFATNLFKSASAQATESRPC